MALNIRIFTMLCVFCLVTWIFTNEAKAQVTFSRDWNPGKRGESPDFRNAMKTAAAVCHLLMSQVRQLTACENKDDLETGSPIFSGGR